MEVNIGHLIIHSIAILILPFINSVYYIFAFSFYVPTVFATAFLTTLC